MVSDPSFVLAEPSEFYPTVTRWIKMRDATGPFVRGDIVTNIDINKDFLVSQEEEGRLLLVPVELGEEVYTGTLKMKEGDQFRFKCSARPQIVTGKQESPY